MKLQIFTLSAMLVGLIHAAGVKFGSDCIGNDKNDRGCEENGGHVVSSVAILRKRSFLARNKHTVLSNDLISKVQMLCQKLCMAPGKGGQTVCSTTWRYGNNCPPEGKHCVKGYCIKN